MSLPQALQTLHQRGFCLDVIYDIGAHDGEWARAIKAQLPDARIILFEANAAFRSAHEGFESYTGVLSDEVKQIEFYTRNSTGDSYYRENSGYFVECQPQRLTTTTLDIMAKNLPQPNFVKLDTQGSELDILAGAQSTLQTTSLILIELPICQYNQKAPSFNQYLSTLAQMRFIPLTVIDVHHSENILVQLDILFAREEDFINHIGKPKIFDIEQLFFTQLQRG